MFPLAKGDVGGRCGALLHAQPWAQALGTQNHPSLRHPKNEAVRGANFLPREVIDFGRGFCTVFGRKRLGWGFSTALVAINGLETCSNRPRSSF